MLKIATIRDRTETYGIDYNDEAVKSLLTVKKNKGYTELNKMF